MTRLFYLGSGLSFTPILSPYIPGWVFVFFFLLVVGLGRGQGEWCGEGGVCAWLGTMPRKHLTCEKKV